ncbi:hypothetical protein M0812_03996 [Anaeramoeba flamelloides]|uniref:Uncharacterized protein n=1 Tax=Anaeramoeba flamelloides TaxID=1746091 RepID=A0AAV8ADL8_9EUKA|nr:hypothetical protein M0812_03996 [Anaeramoeba flamelloides]
MSKEQTYLSTLCENCICENKSTTAKEQTKNYQRLKKSKDSSTKKVRKRVIKSIEEKIEMVQKELESKKIELFEQVEKYLESKNQVISSYPQKVEVIQLALENCHKNLSLFLEKSMNSIEMAKIALENTKILELIDKRSKEINFKKIGLIVSEDEQNDPKLYFSCVSEAIKDLKIFFTQMYQTIVTDKLKLKGPNMKVIKLEKPMVDENLGGIKKTNSVAYSITVWLKISHIENRWRSVFHNGHTNNERKPGVFITPNSTAIHFRQDTKNKKNEGIYLPTNHCPLDKWFFWAVTVNDRHAIHYINSEKVHEGHFSASPLEPTNHLYLVDPWYNTAEGISIGDMLWIPYPISTQYVESLFIKQQLNYL